MRSHEERVAETKRRIAKMEREKRLRRNTSTMASAVAAQNFNISQDLLPSNTCSNVISL